MRSLLKVVALGLSLAAFHACYYATQPSSNSSSSNNVFGDVTIPPPAVLLGPADPTQMLHMVVGLQRNQSGLESYLKQVSDPANPLYHQFLSVSAIAAQFGASAATQQSVLAYMQGQGVTMSIDPTGAFAEGDASVGVVSRVFNTAFGQYSTGASDTFVAPSGIPTLPPALQGVVTEVLGLSTRAAAQQAGNASAASQSSLSAQTTSNQIGQAGSPTSSGTRSGCPDALQKNGFTPNQLRTAYGIDSLRSKGFSGQGVYLALMEGSAFSQSAIDQFTQCYGIDNPTKPQRITLGSKTPSQADEPMLDIEVVLSVAPQLSGLLVFERDLKSYGDWVSLYAAPLNPKYTGGRKIDIISTSVGNCELQWTASAVRLMEHVLLTAATAGISTFASAGDSGSSTCYHHDKTTSTQSAEYPASSTYVTAVGGTNLALNAGNQITGEGVWNDTLFPPPYNTHLGGGGGFSTFVTLPFWQTGTGISSKTRMTPDIALYADPFPGYAIYTDLKGWFDDGGTSAATPLTASAVALLQQMASAKGQTLGPAFLWIYKLTNSSAYQTAFDDVVVGNNDLFKVGCCNAGPGYDTASGWGSPDFSVLAALLIGP